MSTQSFSKTVDLPVSTKEAFAWHERPGALERLIPPWESVEVAARSGQLEEGATVELINRLGPLKLRWLAEHHDYQPGKEFRDTQREGPFTQWHHSHVFRPSDGDQACVLEDRVEYQLPGGWLGNLLGERWVRGKIERMFRYRHQTTLADLSAHAQYADQPLKNIAITGASGLVGSALTPLLTTGGHQVTRLVRSEPQGRDIQWNPAAESFDSSQLNVDAIVHLAGENIGSGRWTAAKKKRIRESRFNGTRVLCEGLAKMKTPPKVLVSASAIGYYGDRGDQLLTEKSEPGTGFLSEVCQEWEEATRPAQEAGIRVVQLRFGVIMSPQGGALAKVLLPFQMGAGGVVGSGKQIWSWISIDDAAGAIHHALMTDSLQGPVNAVSPNPVTNREFTKTLGRILHRPTLVPMPAPMARLALGQMADDLLLASARVQPRKLTASGYAFRQPELETCLRHVLGR